MFNQAAAYNYYINNSQDNVQDNLDVLYGELGMHNHLRMWTRFLQRSETQFFPQTTPISKVKLRSINSVADLCHQRMSLQCFNFLRLMVSAI